LGKKTGFIEFARAGIQYRDPIERIGDFSDITTPSSDEAIKIQGSRCMDCGVPFCQSHYGCPVDNLIPEWNDLVYQDSWKEAFARLQETNNFPEFTGRVCPAPCESACVLGITDPAVTIKRIESAIIDRSYEEGWVAPYIPKARTGYSIAIAGSGPAGLAAADQLNQCGHSVTVYERADRLGGLLTYGIPNMKLEQDIVDRRIHLLSQSGIEFITETNIGSSFPCDDGHLIKILEAAGQAIRHIPVTQVLEKHEVLLLATGATTPKDLEIPGRHLLGIHFAMEYLTRSTREVLGDEDSSLSAKDKDVVVIGGGDTGADCIATSLRQECRSVTNFELLSKPAENRLHSNPWPEWPLIYRVEYAHAESEAKFGKDPRSYCVLSKEFIGDATGRVTGIRTVDVEWDANAGATPFKEIPNSERLWQCDLVLLSMGFIGPEHAVSEDLGLQYDSNSNYQAIYGDFKCSEPRVFAAGDCRRGQSLVVWAINEGRGAAGSINDFLEDTSRANGNNDNAKYS